MIIETDRIDLVYILGFGHSGSTLLSLILGGLDSVAAVGEIWALPTFVRDNLPCSCGKNLSECAYWNRVIDACGQPEGLRSLTGHASGKDLGTASKIEALLSGRFDRLYSPEEIEVFGSTEHALLRTVLENTGASLVLDASKFLDRLVKLHRSPLFRVKVIHLLRDGRATLESAKRALVREEAPRTHLNRLRFVLSWTGLLNLQIRFSRQLPDVDYMRLTYKTLATHPRRTIERLCEFLGVGFDEQVLDPASERYFFKQRHHIIGGNRLTSSLSIDKISYRERWMENLSLWEKAMFLAVAGASNARFVRDNSDRRSVK